MSRSQKREAVFLLLYQLSLNDGPVTEILESTIEEFEMSGKPEDVEWISATAQAGVDYLGKADETINRFSKTRKVERIPKVIAAVLRLAIYEMDCLCGTENTEDVPDKVAVNEGIELCKKYSGEKDSKFVSGVLGSYYREKNENNENSDE
jgi:N utilization substance protein B